MTKIVSGAVELLEYEGRWIFNYTPFGQDSLDAFLQALETLSAKGWIPSELVAAAYAELCLYKSLFLFKS